MFGLLPNPWVIIGVAMAVLSAFGGGYYKGHHDEYLAQQAEIARLNELARETERKLQETANEQATQLKEANDHAQAEISRLNADVQSGALRLSIATRSVPTTDASGATCGVGTEARAELDPKAAQDLIAIAADGDAAIRQANAIIDFYNKVRTTK